MPAELVTSMEPLSLLWASIGNNGIDKAALDEFSARCFEDNNPYGLEISGLLGLGSGQIDLALEAFEKACDMRPASSRLHLLRGVALARRGWKDKASLALGTSQQLGGLDPSVYEMAHDAEMFSRTESGNLMPLVGLVKQTDSVVLASTVGFDLLQELPQDSQETTGRKFLISLCEANLAAFRGDTATCGS
jgi:hypothetical protein